MHRLISILGLSRGNDIRIEDLLIWVSFMNNSQHGIVCVVVFFVDRWFCLVLSRSMYKENGEWEKMIVDVELIDTSPSFYYVL